MNDIKPTNHLVNEKSPYLLQHIYNPVHWYPWGEEAFDKAKQEDKPIFLSIGYSTCHWCHVMEQESFEDEETAELLNRDFVAIKVDREERPDVDAVYMSVCIGLTGSGGWPLTLFLTPEQKPFYAATYLPKKSRYGMSGLDELLSTIAKMWQSDRSELLQSAGKISSFLNKQAEETVSGEPTKELLKEGAAQFLKSFDQKHGGFGQAPKFPSPHNLLFLMIYSTLENNCAALVAAEKTLTQMYRGGIFDHIGGGFSRYSTDRYWLVPHFEKMLYDNALLTLAYSTAFELTKKPLYKTAVEKTISYIFNELTDEEGGFYCGQDADSEGVEGKYYVFTPSELKTVLSETEAETFCRRFDITEQGNFEGNSIPNLLSNPDYEKTDNEIAAIFEKLYSYRKNRTALHKDDKILLSWNGLMIAALAKAFNTFGKTEYLSAAKRAVDFIEKRLTKENKRLFVRYRDGQSAGEGKLDDYAFYAFALLSLYEVTLEAGYLKKCCDIASLMAKHFFDNENGGFFLYADDGEALITRPKEVYDGAVPSGNSVAAFVLNRLYSLTAERKWGELSEKQMRFIAGHVSGYPAGYSFSLLAMIDVLYPQNTLVCTGKDPTLAKKVTAFLKEKKVMPAVLLKTAETQALLSELAPFTKDYPIPESGECYYHCKNGACLTPVSTLEELEL